MDIIYALQDISLLLRDAILEPKVITFEVASFVARLIVIDAKPLLEAGGETATLIRRGVAYVIVVVPPLA